MRQSNSDTALDAVQAHAALAPAAIVIEERRILFRFVTRLLAPEIATTGPALDALDDPLVRHRIGEALAGRITLCDADLTPAAFRPVTAGSATLRVSVDHRTNSWLAAALPVLHPEIADTARPLRLLDDCDDNDRNDADHLDAVLATLASGVALARSVSPRLADDLLAHVTLVAVIEPGQAIVSASSRFFPGLVLLDEPATPLEVAEALVHEGAHQKLFDLAMTRSFLDAQSDAAADFQPSWSTAQWPFEQTLAACHAYYCLAQFADDLAAVPAPPEVHSFSLLPKARDRFGEIAQWLLAHADDLRSDARHLLQILCGAPEPADRPLAEPPPPLGADAFALSAGVHVEPTGSGRVLVGRRGDPPEVSWLDGDAAVLARLLADASPGGLTVSAAAERLRTPSGPAVGAGAPRLRALHAFDALVRSHIAVPSEKVGWSSQPEVAV